MCQWLLLVDMSSFWIDSQKCTRDHHWEINEMETMYRVVVSDVIEQIRSNHYRVGRSKTLVRARVSSCFEMKA